LLPEIGVEDESDHGGIGTEDGSVGNDDDNTGRDTSRRKRPKTAVDSGTQTMPKKSVISALEIKIEDSPTTKELISNAWDRLESVAKIIELQRASKKMMNALS